ARTVRSAGLSPDQLAGIYLVGGSSRLPLVGSLLAEKLGIVPSSLDQPETAVAFGAHHVSPDGLTMRTQQIEGDMAGAQSGAHPVSPPPVTGCVAAPTVPTAPTSPAPSVTRPYTAPASLTQQTPQCAHHP